MAAQNGTMVFVNTRGVRYFKDIYFDDTAGNLVRFDATGGGAGAASPTEWVAPERMTWVDLIIGAATGQTKTALSLNGAYTGDCYRNAIHLATVVYRPAPMIILNPGDKIQLTQLA